MDRFTKTLKIIQGTMAVLLYVAAACQFANGNFDAGCGSLTVGNLNLIGMCAY